MSLDCDFRFRHIFEYFTIKYENSVVVQWGKQAV